MQLILVNLIFLLSSVTVYAEANLDISEDHQKRIELHEECLNNKKFLEKDYFIHCEKNYHHYNSTAFKTRYSRTEALKRKKIKIAEFNALHPGMSKTRYKDYSKVAQMMNQYDVVGVTELIPLMASDQFNNEKVVAFLMEAPEEIKKIKAELKTLRLNQAERPSVVRGRKITLLELKYKQMESDLKKAQKLYREPGYLKILSALHELKDGKDWALVLSPRGEGADTSNTHELVGYYYRASIVKPQSNPYCKKIRTIGYATPIACIINMDANDLGVDKTHVFSRRPFLAEFISGKFSFVLVTSHVIFDSPTDENLKDEIMRSSLGVDANQDIGSRTGLTSNNWARFAEVKVTLEFIQRYMAKYTKDDVIFMGDFNLEAENPYWENILKTWSGSKLYVTEKTSTNEAKYNADGSATEGVTSNYDHFIFNPLVTSECVNTKGEIDGGAFNFQKGRFAGVINKSYKVRKDGSGPTYARDEAKLLKVQDKYIQPYLDGREGFPTIGKIQVSYKDEDGRLRKMPSVGIYNDDKETEFHIENFVNRIIETQFHDESYYAFYEQLISDHLPIYMSCSNN